MKIKRGGGGGGGRGGGGAYMAGLGIGDKLLVRSVVQAQARCLTVATLGVCPPGDPANFAFSHLGGFTAPMDGKKRGRA